MSQQYAQKGTPNRIENIAIVGATGWSGKYIVESILKNGNQKITAITRSDSKAQMPSGITVKKVNYDDHASLTEALRGQDALIITMGARAPPTQQTKLIDAAAAANVPWILPNEFGNDNANETLRKDVMINAHKTQFRDLIQQLGKSSWIGICCGFWYEFSLGGGPDRYGFDIAKREVVFFDEGTQALSTSTWAQNGRGVANLLNLKIHREGEDDKSPCLTDFKEKFVYIASFVVSQKDMLESLLRVTKTEMKDWKVTYEDSHRRYEEGLAEFQKGDFRGMARAMYTRNFWADGLGNHAVTRGLDNEKLGLPKEDLDEATREAVRMAEDGTLATYG
ncbi:MAG: hypothetical protein Q9218_004381 [Villophora microphyllina]